MSSDVLPDRFDAGESACGQTGSIYLSRVVVGGKC